MRTDVNGTTLWYDVEGTSGPTLILIHGGPGSFDHSYFRPWFSRLADRMQIVYLDLRDHGRSGRGDPEQWSFEVCADDVRAFADALGLERPFALGHSMGGFIAILYGARHPGHAAGLILSSTFARFDLDRLANGFARVAGHDVGELARRAYSVDDVTEDEAARVFAAFGPNIPSPEALARRVQNLEIAPRGGELLRQLDLLDQLPRITSPTLVSVGDLDPLMFEPAGELMNGLAPGLGHLDVIPGAGHFAWLDDPDRYFNSIDSFVKEVELAAHDLLQYLEERSG
jgi:pimeloyl-ACP methyl ester carboxylesterase